jgi:hypothetical protein
VVVVAQLFLLFSGVRTPADAFLSLAPYHGGRGVTRTARSA